MGIVAVLMDAVVGLVGAGIQRDAMGLVAVPAVERSVERDAGISQSTV